ncbi:nuclear transport factor 2 family protein [Streptomyces sp. NPDC001478]
MSGLEERLVRLESRVRELEERERSAEVVEGEVGARGAVLDQLHRLQAALDARDWDTVRKTFTADATGYGRQGVEAIVDVVKGHLGGCGPTQHLLGNTRLVVEGSRARSFSHARVHHEGAGSMRGSFFECMGEYEDRWAQTEEG